MSVMIKRCNRFTLLLAGLLTVGVAAAIGPASLAATAGQLAPLLMAVPDRSGGDCNVATNRPSPGDGWRFAIADDSDPDKALGDRFVRLRPKTFRFQVPWDAGNSKQEMDRAQNLICRARAQGVRQIVVTFRGKFDPKPHYQPPASEYRRLVKAFVQQFAPQVDVWGPANEPNWGYAWLPGNGGAKKLAQYYKHLKAVKDQYDPSALLLSPEFHDYSKNNKKRLQGYIHQYVHAGGGFGDVIGWHPYVGLNQTLNGKPHPSARSTADFLNILGQHSNAKSQKVWITEVGAYGEWHYKTKQKESSKAQDMRVRWLVSPHGPLRFNRITRVYYYHMLAVRNPPKWDSGLTGAETPEADASPRPAWYTWCAASHGGNRGHVDCR